MTHTPGQPYDTGVATVGGRGQQAIQPFEHVRHTVTITSVSRSVHEDHYVTATEAIIERAARLRDQGLLFTRDGMTLTYVDNADSTITLRYEDAL